MDKLTELALGGLGVIAITFVCLYLRRIAQDSSDNAESINSISANVARIHNQIIAEFVNKEDFHPLVRRVDGLERDVTELQTKTGVAVRR